MSFISPTGFNDPNSKWLDETLVYDENIDTKAYCPDIPTKSWGSFIELTHSSIRCTGLRFWAGWSETYVNAVDIDAYYGGTWNHVYEGTYTNRTEVQKAIDPAQYVTAIRFRFYNNSSISGQTAGFYEADFYESPLTAPTVTTPAVTDIGGVATGNGNITSTGGENATKRGVCWNTTGNPTVANSKSEETGSFGTGAFTRPITGLSPDQIYYVRAYAYNSIGYGYGSDVTVKTPTVTTPAVTDILSVTATGNGNITATGGLNATKRGVCWNTTGSPTTANSKAESSGSFGTGTFTSSMTGLSPGILYYVRAYAINAVGTSYGAEVNFTTLKVAPTVTIQTPTVILPTTVTANGNITATGGENSTERGFKYGLTKTNTWEKHETGSYGLGAFNLPLTNLSPNTAYWIQAYALNSIGTSYSAWVEFQTAAAGVIPTGTNLFIAADLSGYSYQLMKSLTDDGEPYTSYFIINTDLTEDKTGLSWYKRILDLDLYYRCEDSGTSEIYVMRDSEAEFQFLGSVDLTDVKKPTIIIRHLAVDIRGKYFDFKVSYGNACRFLGVVFKFLPAGDR